MLQVDLANPTLEFTDYDPSIAAEYGASDSINYLMHNLGDLLGIADNLIVLPLMFLFNLLMAWIIIYCIYYKTNKPSFYFSYNYTCSLCILYLFSTKSHTKINNRNYFSS